MVLVCAPLSDCQSSCSDSPIDGCILAVEWYVLSEFIKVDDMSRKNVRSDNMLHKCLSSSVGNTEDHYFLLSLLRYPKYSWTFRYSPSLVLSLGTKLGFVYLHGLS